MTFLFLLLTSAFAAAQAPFPSVAALKEQFQSAIKQDEKMKALTALSRTPPVSAQDVTSLFDLFERFPDQETRKAAMDSLALIPRDSPALEPLFIRYLKMPEPEAQLFGINGAFRMRSLAALPLVRRIAGKRLRAADAADIAVLSERNAWWTQYEALSALAQWEGEQVLPLLRAKTEESPLIARLLGRFFWRQTFPSLRPWSESKDDAVKRRSFEAASAPIESADARATRAEMLLIVGDSKADPELRHQLALKVGACSNDAEVDALIGLHDASKDERSKLLWAGAVFAARSPRAAPLLARYALNGSDEESRKGARAELIELVGENKAAEMTAASKSQKESTP